MKNGYLIFVNHLRKIFSFCVGPIRPYKTNQTNAGHIRTYINKISFGLVRGATVYMRHICIGDCYLLFKVKSTIFYSAVKS